MTQKVPKITFNDVAFFRTRPIFISKFLADMTKDQNHLEPNFSDLNNFCITGAVFLQNFWTEKFSKNPGAGE